MQLSTRGRYAVMAMVDLASSRRWAASAGRSVWRRSPAGSSSARPTWSTVRQAAARRAGGSARGPGGGYRLARGSDAIAIADIIAAVEEPIRATRCEGGSAGLHRRRWRGAAGTLPDPRSVGGTGRQIRLFLRGVTLADVVPAGCCGRADAADRGVPAGWRPSSRCTTSTPTPPSRCAPRRGRPCWPRWRSPETRPRCMPPDARRGGSWRMRARRWPPGSARGRQNLVFTSGGTEADALAIHAFGAGRRVIVCATEHDAVRSAAPGAAILPVDRDGVADLERLRGLLADQPRGPGLPDAGEQRDRHDPAGRRGRRALPPAWRAAACRCGAGGRADGCRILPALARTAWRFRRTSWAARPAPVRCCWRRTSPRSRR